ncbi:MAG: alpha-glucan family phosphorylase [Clostridia bacterium]
MYAYEKITVVPKLPEKINRLNDLAYNLWWSWNTHILEAFKEIDPELWSDVNENPAVFIQQVSSKKLEKASNDPNYLQKYADFISEFDAYMNSKDTWFDKNHPPMTNNAIAYFSAEYGLHPTLPIYSGGLGVLSGDYCKSASDLGLPFIAIGLLYKKGYFIQHINHEGWQEAKFLWHNVSELPVISTKDQEGNQIIIAIDFPGRIVYAKIFEIHVGRIKIYMLDTDIPDNNSEDRHITSTLYGGDQEMRISQEIILGIGGIKMLDALGIQPKAYHLNEGHSAFCTLELMRKLIQNEGLAFHSAREVVAASTIFTTHTPVPAGSDRFPSYIIDKYLSNMWTALKISRHQFLELGMDISSESPDVFNMTVLALKMSGQRNGVSKLHGMVSRNIFNNIWHGIPEEEVPIDSVTNGIHTATWLSSSLRYLYDKYLGQDWKDHISDSSMWNNIHNIPDEELWNAHINNKQEMISFVKERLKKQKTRNGVAHEEIEELREMLETNALTIGFARRFATYKRANLIFRNIVRLQRIINNPAMPVQIIFAGKAHPADYPGQELIKQIHDLANREGFKGKVFLIENYDMELAKYLVSGVDIWLNNPRRPLEASGTSGQKAALNGIMNLSILDGWWVEGYNAQNGWIIGDDTYYTEAEHQDNVDSQSLYTTLEEQVIPTYYERNAKGIPDRWIQMMKESIRTCAPTFSTARMVQDYTNGYYIPTIRRGEEISKDYYTLAKELTQWKTQIYNEWGQIKITPDRKLEYEPAHKIFAGRPIQLSATVYLGNIDPNNVRVEVYYGKIGDDGMIDDPDTGIMTLQEDKSNHYYRYEGTIHLDTGGEYGYTFRILPYHSELINEYDLGLIKWVDGNEHPLQ